MARWWKVLWAKVYLNCPTWANDTYSQMLGRGVTCDFCVLGRFPLATLWIAGWEGTGKRNKRRSCRRLQEFKLEMDVTCTGEMAMGTQRPRGVRGDSKNNLIGWLWVGRGVKGGGKPDDTHISNQSKYLLMQCKWHLYHLLSLLGIIHTLSHIDRGALFLLILQRTPKIDCYVLWGCSSKWPKKRFSLCQYVEEDERRSL